MPLVAIVGPTASGKSDVAMALAEAAPGEIVACDSVQIYRRFDIGSAKPTPEEQARVPHHLIDVANWDEDFDAQRYVTLARQAIDAIGGRGHLPIVCGGTGLYLRALRYGLVEVPKADQGLRDQLMAAEAAQPGALYARLQRVDPFGAQRMEPNNIVHIVRALEISLSTGEPASTVRIRHGFRAEAVPMRIIALQWPAPLLKERVVSRVARMVEGGLLDEVERLLSAGVSPACRAMRSLGYKEASEVLRGLAPRAGLEQRIAKGTWTYARRQRTWLRRERDVAFCDIQSVDEAVAAVRKILR